MFTSLFLAFNFKAGKENVITSTPGLFACKNISFNESFSSGQQVRVLASVGHSVKSPTPRYGAAIWVENVTARGFTVCVLEFGEGSNETIQMNWIALQGIPRGSQLGSISLSSWTTGTKCEKINFQQVSCHFKIVLLMHDGVTVGIVVFLSLEYLLVFLLACYFFFCCVLKRFDCEQIR